MKVMAGPALVPAEETLEFLSTAGVPATTTLILQGTGLAMVTLLKKCKGGSVFRRLHGIIWSIIKLIAYCTGANMSTGCAAGQGDNSGRAGVGREQI